MIYRHGQEAPILLRFLGRILPISLILTFFSCNLDIERSEIPLINLIKNSIPISTVTVSSPLTYTSSEFTFTIHVPISEVTPSYQGTIIDCSVSPTLPTGLSLNTGNCSITGTPTVLSEKTIYTVKASISDSSVSTTLTITVNDSAPTSLAYSGTPFTFTKGVTITSVSPTVTGTPIGYSITPELPSGLSMDTGTGVISGTPSLVSPSANYTVTATNSGGSSLFNINITVIDTPPSGLSYTGSPFVFTQSSSIPNLTPSVTGSVVSYSVSPALPSGLLLNTGTGIISGSPSALSVSASYTITATNSGGSTNTSLNIAVVSSLSECTGYSTILGDDRHTGLTGGSLCDSTLSGLWRRFTGTYVTMPTSVVNPSMCNTDATGYMTFPHPSSPGSSFSGKVCFNWSGNICAWSVTISVSNCNGFYVYMLPSTPTCSLRYCTQ